MKLNKLIIFSTAILLNAPLFAEELSSNGTKLPPEFLSNLPPGEYIEALPEPIMENPPVYLDVDSKGNVYRIKLVRDKLGNYISSNELVTQPVMNDLLSQRTVVLQNMENRSLPGEFLNQEASATSTSTCPLPYAFTIWGDTNGNAMGDQIVSNTYRPVGATTQWIVFDFYTTSFRNRGSHMPTVLFHDDILHGWGAFIGDNHEGTNHDGTYAGCGDSARFNSQTEGWLQTTPPADPINNPITPLWQSYVFNSTNSCGSEMYDGAVFYETLPFARYRMEMQASTGHWVSYRIFEFKINPLRWSLLTDWKTLDVDTGNWKHTPLQWLTGTQGIFMGATDAGIGTSWFINISNTQCGWF